MTNTAAEPAPLELLDHLAEIAYLTEQMVTDDAKRDYAEALWHARDAAVRLEEVTRRFAARARAGGLSWSTIGAALGITRQAAQQRFGAL